MVAPNFFRQFQNGDFKKLIWGLLSGHPVQPRNTACSMRSSASWNSHKGPTSDPQSAAGTHRHQRNRSLAKGGSPREHKTAVRYHRPISTALKYVDCGADGVLNLMTLNCSYGTVVTAALLRALKQRDRVPMLTLVFDGLKKTNEKTRLEAFMEQVWDHFKAAS